MICIPCHADKPHFWHDDGTRADLAVPSSARRYPPSLLAPQVTWDYYTPNNTGVPRA